MKIKNLTSWIAVVAIAAIIFSGCKKEQTQPLIDNTNQSADLASSEINILAEQADNDFANAEYSGGTENEVFAMCNDGLPDAYTVTEATADEINSSKRDGEGNSLRKCLSTLSLSGEQIAKIKRVFKAHEDCSQSVIARHRHAQRELLTRYNDKLEALVKALKNDRITKAQFEEMIKKLRKNYSNDRVELTQKGRAALKACYIKLLRGLNQVLSDKQWKAFVNCYRH